MDNVASIDLARALSAFVNLAMLLFTHFWKIKFSINFHVLFHDYFSAIYGTTQ
jgi:hypothetical protein